MPLSGAVTAMSSPKVKEKVTKMLDRPRKKMKKLLSRRRPRKGYAKIAVQHDQVYEDEDLEMEIDLNYGINEAYECTPEQHSVFRSTKESTTGGVPSDGESRFSRTHGRRTSVAQTFLDDILATGIYRKTEFCLVPFFLLTLMASVLTTALLAVRQISDWWMGVLCAFSVAGSVLGSYAVYQWGVFDDVMAFLSAQNGRYRDNLERLDSMGEVLMNDVNDIHRNTELLNRDGSALEEAVAAYDALGDDLLRICNADGDRKENAMPLLEELQALREEMATVLEDHEKARLLQIFYSVSLYDYGGENCMDREQYALFLTHCAAETRARFEKCGGFDAMNPNLSGMVEHHHFEQMVQKVLAETVEDSQHRMDSAIEIKDNL